MSSSRGFIIVGFLSFLLFLSPDLYARELSKAELINKQLDCVSRELQGGSREMTWADICYSQDTYEGAQSREQKVLDALEQQERYNTQSIADTQPAEQVAAADQPAVQYPESVNEQFEREITPAQSLPAPKPVELKPAKNSTLTGALNRRNSMQKFELGYETFAYRYREPSLGVKFDGQHNGIYSSYTLRISENKKVNSLSDVLAAENKVNMFRIEARYSGGNVNYEGTGTWKGIDDSAFEMRGLAGYDLPTDVQSRFTPYAGLGYRYLMDNFSKVPARRIDGVNYLSGYDRESQYLYIPFGLEYEKQLPSQWTVGGTIEYDFFLWGKQKSHLEDSKNLVGTNAGYSTSVNEQNDGRGFRASVKAVRETQNMDFMMEPFFRYWRIEDSEINDAGYEPVNNTKELGVRLGIRY